MLGNMGPHGYYGYAHIICYEADQAETRQAEQERVAAKQCISIAIWFSWDGALKPAPNTGHADREVRMIPTWLPELPAGSVIYEQYRRPFAMSSIDIPSVQEAEAWWQAATADKDAAYEIHWYGDGADKKATRSWKGRGFSRVESDARWHELEAESGYRAQR